MKLPRDLSGEDLSRLLQPYGYVVTRQTGSHIRLTSSSRGGEHHVTILNYKNLKVGTLAGVLSEIERYLEINREELSLQLFG